MLNQGGHGIPPADDVYGPGPTIESVDSSSVDPADIAIPDDGTDFDLEDGDFWTTGWQRSRLTSTTLPRFSLRSNDDMRAEYLLMLHGLPGLREAVAAPPLRRPEGQGRPTTTTTLEPYGNQINPLSLNFVTGNPKATNQLHTWYSMPTSNGR